MRSARSGGRKLLDPQGRRGGAVGAKRRARGRAPEGRAPCGRRHEGARIHPLGHTRTHTVGKVRGVNLPWFYLTRVTESDRTGTADAVGITIVKKT